MRTLFGIVVSQPYFEPDTSCMQVTCITCLRQIVE